MKADNIIRANRAKRAVGHYEESSDFSKVSALLTDLRHYCELAGVEFALALVTSRDAYEKESGR